ncbi:endonuclease [Candidatus Roizmanbacteria bacterium RIFCSPLOWO2_01_FULL_38_12]|uniref:Endonuclease n=1 Tax=Candidatus Roizmanbacteria bacterium RIFCSPLOWO2_01_FULL_38_12 TaxID=1802061 RepID=A0A1F7IYR1_9BACT|nr:MAG: endonuclease [Candidatus Roizmanbacteria bacterium RIFCSPHIGHO2_01_FULL_38_15]OGK35778.1 MAG: endonuclease [Candidatus Roizmanbacteria bacterium RIFCSPHIGHO2_12_FULL_38_13]OGK48502.1 MAG: endonuclease [Candidatus Roizmanbacteria bacterium RIFCSPLOWO2_01_FULL_38_12]
MTTAKLFYFYIVRCADDSLYSGITTDLKRRVGEHNSKKLGAKYTRSKQPVTLIYKEKFSSKSAAMKREWEVKQMTKSEKELLIAL